MHQILHVLRNALVPLVGLSAMVSCSSQPADHVGSSLATVESDGVALISYSPSAQRQVDTDSCARVVAEASAVKIIEVMSGQGVDIPSALHVLEIDSSVEGRRSSNLIWKISFEEFAFRIKTTDSCQVIETKKMNTVRRSVDFESEELRVLSNLGGEYLGIEFFGQQNIGSAFSFKVGRHDSPLSPVEMLKSHYSEWMDVVPSADLVNDISAKGLKSELELLMISDQNIDGADDQTGEVAQLFFDNLHSAVKKDPSLVLVRGVWFGRGIGDPTASFLAIVNSGSGNVLVLEQGYVD